MTINPPGEGLVLDSASRISLSESPPVSNQVIGRMLKLSPSRSVGEWGPCRILCADAPVSNVETKKSESRGRRLRGPRGRLLRRSRSRLGPVACAGAPSPPGRMRDPARARPRPARVSSRGRTRPPGAVRPPSAVGSPPRLIALMAVDRRLDALDVDRGGRAGPVPASPGATRRLEESPACAVSPIPHPPASPRIPPRPGPRPPWCAAWPRPRNGPSSTSRAWRVPGVRARPVLPRRAGPGTLLTSTAVRRMDAPFSRSSGAEARKGKVRSCWEGAFTVPCLARRNREAVVRTRARGRRGR